MKERHLAEERRLLRAALELCDWIMLRAAKVLGIEFSTLQRIVKRHPDVQKTLKRRGRGPGRP